MGGLFLCARAQDNTTTPGYLAEEEVLIQNYEQATDFKEKIVALEYLAFHYCFQMDTVKALKYGELYKKLASKSEDPELKRMYYGGIAPNYALLDREMYNKTYQEGMDYAIGQNDSLLILKLTSAYADYLFLEEKDYQKSLTHLKKAQVMNKSIKDKKEEAYILSALGRASAKLGDLNVAAQYMREAKDIFEDPTLKLSAYLLLCEYLKRLNEIEKAQVELDKAFVHYERAVDMILKGDYHRIKALLLIEQGKLEEAIAAFNEEKQTYFPQEKNDGSREFALGNGYALNKEYSQAINWYKEAVELGLSHKKQGYGAGECAFNAYEKMAEVYAITGKHQQAYNSLLNRNTLAKDLENDVEKEMLNDLIAKYESEKKETENKLVKAQNEKLKTQNVLYSAIGVTAVLFLGLLSFLMTKLLLQKKKLQQSNERLSNANQTKNQLFQIIGHDLKKPAIAFQNMGKNLSYLVQKNNANDLLEYAEHVETESLRLYKTVDNLLNWGLTQKEGFEPEYKTFGLLGFVNEVVEEMQSILDSKQLTVHKKLSVEEVKSDPDVLKIVLRNLLHNSTKFTPNKGDIIIFASQKEGEFWELGVEDNGAGFPQHAVSTIMEGKTKTTTLGTNSEAGNGLGLQLVKELIAKLNGKIEIQNKESTGAQVVAKFELLTSEAS